jgi:hypothetical protein
MIILLLEVYKFITKSYLSICLALASGYLMIDVFEISDVILL